MTCAAADCKGQGSFFYSGVDDSRFTVENEDFCDNPSSPLYPTYPPQRNSLGAMERTAKNCDKDALYNSCLLVQKG